jgi:hypothetical protein
MSHQDKVNYFYCAVGVAVSVVIPIIRHGIPQFTVFGITFFAGTFAGGVWPTIKPYIVLGIFSLVVAFVIVASVGDTLNDWRAAFLAGYAFDSTLQKLKG